MGDQQHTSLDTLFDEIGYFFFELKTIFNVIPMILVELIVLVLVSLMEVSLDFTRPLDEFFMFDLCEHLGDGDVEGRQY